ncbi:MAG: hypothetical protein AAF942_03195, partial [Pseudomonadota bacterium]
AGGAVVADAAAVAAAAAAGAAIVGAEGTYVFGGAISDGTTSATGAFMGGGGATGAFSGGGATFGAGGGAAAVVRVLLGRDGAARCGSAGLRLSGSMTRERGIAAGGASN